MLIFLLKLSYLLIIIFKYEEYKSFEHADPICAFCHKAFPNTELIPILKIAQKNYMNVNIVDYL